MAFIRNTFRACGCEILHDAAFGKGCLRLSYRTRRLSRVEVLCHLLPLHGYRASAKDPDGGWATVRAPAALSALAHVEAGSLPVPFPLLLAVDVVRGFLVGFDLDKRQPEAAPLHVSISGEMVRQTLQPGWHAWEREGWEEAEWGFAETLIGVTPDLLPSYVDFAMIAQGLDTGPRHQLAEIYFGQMIRPTLRTPARIDPC